MHPRALLALCLALLCLPASAALRHPGVPGALASGPRGSRQDTGFLNRTLDLNGTLHRYVVYLPENWSPSQSWPVILFLHGSGERGSEGLDQTQIGLPQAIRLHPERWPFVVVMPQVPFSHHHWTDPDMMAVAMAALNDEVKEFHGDPERLILTGLSLGGYGAWEIARTYPRHFAALVPVCGGVFWSYQPERWREVNTLPAEKIFGTPFSPLPRNTEWGQPISTINMAVFKDTRVTERLMIEFQAEAFNLFNHQWLGIPIQNVNAAVNTVDGVNQFGSNAFNFNGGDTFAGNMITDGIGRRRLQFGAKIIF